jgi:hypothetical protein
MKKTILMMVAAIPFVAAPAFAMDCGNMLDQSSEHISKMTKASAEKRAALRRMAMTGYDHCMAGDTLNAERYWKMIQNSLS